MSSTQLSNRLLGRTACNKRRDSAYHQWCDLWREYASSGMARPLVTYHDGGRMLWIKQLDCCKLSNVTCCTQSQFMPSTNFLFYYLKMLLREISHKHVRFPGNDIAIFPMFLWLGYTSMDFTITDNWPSGTAVWAHTTKAGRLWFLVEVK